MLQYRFSVNENVTDGAVVRSSGPEKGHAKIGGEGAGS
jgi:hypothetical protein